MRPSNWPSPSVSVNTTGCPRIPTAPRVAAARLREAEGDLDAALAIARRRRPALQRRLLPQRRPVPAARPGSGCAAANSHAKEWAGECGISADDELRICASTSTSPWPGCCSPGGRRPASLDKANRPLAPIGDRRRSGRTGRDAHRDPRAASLSPQAASDPSAALSSPAPGGDAGRAGGLRTCLRRRGRTMATLLKTLVRQGPGFGYARRLWRRSPAARSCPSFPRSPPSSSPSATASSTCCGCSRPTSTGRTSRGSCTYRSTQCAPTAATSSASCRSTTAVRQCGRRSSSTCSPPARTLSAESSPPHSPHVVRTAHHIAS